MAFTLPFLLAAGTAGIGALPNRLACLAAL